MTDADRERDERTEQEQEQTGEPGSLGAQPREKAESNVHPVSEEGMDPDRPVRAPGELAEEVEPEEDEEGETLPAKRYTPEE